MTTTESPIDWLRAEFVARRTKNPAYSLRAFAGHLRLSPGRLSELLARKQPLTRKVGERIADRMGLDPVAKTSLLTAIEQGRGRPTVKHREPAPAYRQLEVDTFHLIADWYHFALLSLAETATFKPDLRWIARRLGITTTEARAAIERLERIGALRREGGRLVVTGNLETTQDIPSAALRRSHTQSLTQAIAALESIAVELRDVTSITMAVDVGKLPAAKDEIRRFRKRLAKLLESSGDGPRTEVYNLNVQLVPVTKP